MGSAKPNLPQDGLVRCGWCEKDDLYRAYHDTEWGRPSRDDHHLFEMLILESFQAGLSWHTILKKREHFREAFDNFDVQKVAAYDESKIAELLNNSGIIRNKLKVLAAVNNAQVFIRLQQEFGSFANYIWGFTDQHVIDNRPKTLGDIPATTAISDTMAKDMKKRGFKFMGSTVCYANMQSIGMVNDHTMDCHCRE